MERLDAFWRALWAYWLLACAAPVAAQQDYPRKPVRLISPYAAGGGNSILSRIIAEKLTDRWGQQVIVDSRGGGNTVIGTELVANAVPDGYTLLFAGGSHVIIPHLVKTPYHPIDGFAAVAMVGKNEIALVLGQAVAANTLQEFIALAKSRPGQLNFASYGSGSASHLAAELFNIVAGTRTQHVPYKGAAPALTDLVGGHVQLFFSPPLSLISHIKSGRIKCIAITGESRSPTLPQVPTFAEAGLTGFEMRIWYGVLAPHGTPRATTEKVSNELARIMAAPDTKERMNAQGVEPRYAGSSDFVATMKADHARFAGVIRTAGIKLEQ